MNNFDIAVVYENEREKKILDKFVKSINTNGVNINVEEMSKGYMAGVHWLMPTAVFIFITKAYFDSFFTEMGKEHYHKLTNALIDLKEEFFGEKIPKRVLISSSSSPNKIQDKSDKYSLDFSIMAEANNGNKFKLLIPKEISNQEYSKTIICFLSFLQRYNNDEIEEIPNEFIFSKTILFSYNSELDKLEFLNPFNKEDK